MCALPRHYLTPEEYLQMERQAPSKSEYLRGEVFAMAGASRQHVTIMTNTIVALGTRLKAGPCMVFGSDLRVKVPPTRLYTYPDVSVVCGKPQFEDSQQDTLVNPTVILEILSRATEGYDRGEKFENYRTLASLSDYVLVSQHRPLVEHFARQPDESWLLKAYAGLDAILPLRTIGCEPPLAEIYDKVEWPEEEVRITGIRLVREESGDYEVEHEFEGGLYANRPDPPGLYR